MQKIAFKGVLAKLNCCCSMNQQQILMIKRNKIFDILEKQKITIIKSTHDPKMFKNVDFNYNIVFEDEKDKS